MTRTWKNIATLLAVCLSMIGMAAPAVAAYPERPITIVLPFGAGSGADRIFRVAQPYMEKALGQKLIPDYKAGGGGVVGSNYFMTTKPDGYTLLFYNQPHIIIQERFQKTAYNSKNLLPFLGLTWRPDIITVSVNSPIKSMEEFIAYAKANPGKLTVGNTGSYSSNHLTFALLSQLADIKMTRIPFESGGKMNAALLGDQISACVSNMQWLAVHEGKLRVLASTAAERPAADIPTFKELGYPDLVDISAMNVVYGREGMPEEVVTFLRGALAPLVNDEQMKADYIKEGIDYGMFNWKEMQEITDLMEKQVNMAKDAIAASAQ